MVLCPIDIRVRVTRIQLAWDSNQQRVITNMYMYAARIYIIHILVGPIVHLVEYSRGDEYRFVIVDACVCV